MQIKKINIYTDGACNPNPGSGGWAYVTECGKAMSGSEKKSTNQRMEMMAVLRAIEHLHEPGAILNIHTDSQFVIDGCTKWLSGWKAKGWKKKSKGEIKNLDIWMMLDEALSVAIVKFYWVKGHSGVPLNELANNLAEEASLLGLS